MNRSEEAPTARMALSVGTAVDRRGTLIDASDAGRRRRWRFEVCPEVVARTRSEVTDLLVLWKWDGLAERICLCLTELLTNVIKYVDGHGCDLVLEDVGTGVRVTVSDNSRRLPVVREPDPFAESGRGMHLIAALASTFGSAPTIAGKDVWAEFHADTRTPH